MESFFPCSILKMMQNVSKPKGKYLMIVLWTIKDEKSAATVLTEVLKNALGRGESEQNVAA